MAWSNASIVHSYKCCEHMSRKRLTGNAFSRLSCMLVALQYIPLQAFPPSSSRSGFHHRNLSFIRTCTAHDPSSYHGQLLSKLAQLRDFVETNIAEKAHHQKISYDHHVKTRSFQVGDSVWLSIPTAGKLDPRWEGKWVVHSFPGPTCYTMSKGCILQ